MKSIRLGYPLLLALYALVGYQSYGFDDEFYNIRLIETLGFGAVSHVQTTDVHPPGSYLINWVLFSLLGEWALVRTVGALMAAAAILFFIERLVRRGDIQSAVVALLVLGLSPSLLMWCTSLRWYAYFVPQLILLCAIVDTTSRFRWWALSLGFVSLAYIGYVAFLLLPALAWLFWQQDSRPPREKLFAAALPTLVGLLLCSPQIQIFLTVHLGNSAEQTGSLVQSLMGFVVGHLSNSGVFPLSVAGLLSISGSTMIGWILLKNTIPRQRGISDDSTMAYLTGGLVLIASGLAAKFRNLVTLTPLQTLAIVSIDSEKRSRWFWLGVTLLSIGNLWGVRNVVAHQGTAKLGWNMPYEKLFEELSQERDRCQRNLTVFTYDPSLAWHLKNQGYAVISSVKGIGEASSHNSGCLVLLKTFAGNRGGASVERLVSDVPIFRETNVRVVRLGRDPNYVLKQKLDPSYPEYAVELSFAYIKSELPIASSWQAR
jgi:hypothetical protein